VNEGDMDGSLLGMEYLGRYAIEITGDQMILRR
jgi:aspartyl protease family protein